MSCKRCEDIHTAQKDGKQLEPCRCDCHNDYNTTATVTGDLLFNNDSVTCTNLGETGFSYTVANPDSTTNPIKCDCTDHDCNVNKDGKDSS